MPKTDIREKKEFVKIEVFTVDHSPNTLTAQRR